MFRSSKITYIIISMLITGNSYCNIDSLKQNDHYIKHLTFSDTFFGNEDMYQVCYPKDHRSMFYFIIIFSIISVVLGVLVIYIKTNSNKKLKQKNEIIAEQNKDLIDSINYAQRIQQAILPDSILTNNVLKNGFVFYKPKHIVSGDFYWVHKTKNLSFIALMDCTGHGVPGALLTMLGYNAINEAVIGKGLTDPALILDHMNTDVKAALKQNQNKGIQDSMEVAIVCINSDSNQLLFAGANLSLQLVQNGKLQIINGGKCSVGSVQEHVVDLPVTHSIQLSSGNSFYLYSDGYADQFGGPKGKKFKYKQLEQLLLSNIGKTKKDQLTALEQTFNSWKNGLEQVDDVTVIGVNIV